MKSWLYVCALVAGLSSAARAAPPVEPVDVFIERYAKDHDFNGVVLVARGAKPTYMRAFGLANLAFQVANTVDTRFKIASITKAFTAALVLQLRDQGKLDLDKTIGAYLPGYTGPARDKATLHQLLDHTSGLDNFDKVKSADDAVKHGIPSYQLPHTVDELITSYCSGPLVHKPGSTFDYNNGEYILLGKIIEQVTGQPFEQVLQQRILAPLHMASSGLARQDQIIPNLAETYFKRDGKTLGPDLPAYPENWYAAGAMYSTAHDLLAFAQGLFGGKLVSAASLALMLKPGLDDYGYGVWTYDAKIRGATYHIIKRPGQIMGAQTQLYHFMSPDITVILLSNTGTTDLDEMVAEIGKRSVP